VRTLPITPQKGGSKSQLVVFTARCLSVTRVLCDETKERTADILIPHESVIILVFWLRQWLAGNVLFHLKFAIKLKSADFDQYLQELAKKFNYRE